MTPASALAAQPPQSRLPSVREAYIAALREYVQGGGERSLAQAHRLGRRAIAEGLGLLDIIAAHEAACAALGEPSRPSDAMSFLAETLSPYEMAQRGFRESVETTKLKSQLVALASHEFANGLSVLECALSCLEGNETEAPDKERRNFYEIARSNIKAMALASTNLLNLGRLEAGRYKLELRPTRLRSLLRDTMHRLEVLYKRKGLDVTIDVPRNAQPLRADPEALMFVFSNLLSNAVKYTPEGGKIRAGVLRPSPEGEADLYVRDSGIGIPAADRERIFKGFYRTDSGRMAAEGFGVGLSLVKRIVEAHGSELKVESHPGAGSMFWFRLPHWEAETN